MKFLITVRPGPMPPPLEAVNAARVWLEQKVSDGTFEALYAFPGGGGMSVCSTGSHEELMDLMLEYPLSPFVVYDTEPLVDFDASFTRLTAYIEGIQAQIAAHQ